MLPPQNCSLVVRKSRDHVLKGKQKGEEMSTLLFPATSLMRPGKYPSDTGQEDTLPDLTVP